MQYALQTDDASGGDVAPLVGAEVDGQRGRKKSAMFLLRRNPKIDDVVLPKRRKGGILGHCTCSI